MNFVNNESPSPKEDKQGVPNVATPRARERGQKEGERGGRERVSEGERESERER